MGRGDEDLGRVRVGGDDGRGYERAEQLLEAGVDARELGESVADEEDGHVHLRLERKDVVKNKMRF